MATLREDRPRGAGAIMAHVQLPADAEGNSEFQMPNANLGTKDTLMIRGHSATPKTMALRGWRGGGRAPSRAVCLGDLPCISSKGGRETGWKILYYLYDTPASTASSNDFASQM